MNIQLLRDEDVTRVVGGLFIEQGPIVVETTLALDLFGNSVTTLTVFHEELGDLVSQVIDGGGGGGTAGPRDPRIPG